MQLIILIVFAALMYGLLIVPQQKRMKAQRQLLESLSEGDHVLTSSGLYGNVIEFEGSVMWLEIARGVEIKMSRDSVQAIIGDDAESSPAADEASDDTVEPEGGAEAESSEDTEAIEDDA